MNRLNYFLIAGVPSVAPMISEGIMFAIVGAVVLIALMVTVVVVVILVMVWKRSRRTENKKMRNSL